MKSKNFKILVFADSHGSTQQMLKVIAHEHHDLVIHAGDHLESAEFMNEFFDY
jgi:predicted phosphodiesterase